MANASALASTVSSLFSTFSTRMRLALAVTALIGACTSTTSPAIDNGDGGTGDGGTTQKEGGATDAKGGTDANPTTDSSTGDETPVDEDAGPVVCTAISGGLACDPGHIYCGASNCDATTEECCVNITSAPGSTCKPKGTCGTDVAVACDEKDDCQAGEVCCFTANGTTPKAAVCQVGPCLIEGNPTQFAQSCRGPDECASGQCVEGTCKGYKVQTCVAFPSAAACP